MSFKKYKVTSGVIRRANSSLIRKGISETTRNSYDGDINVRYHSKKGFVVKSFSNSDIKSAFEKALSSYEQKI